MRKILLLIFTLYNISILTAQQNQLVIEGSKPSFYLIHKVLPKENFYSVGRLYNVSPKEIAPFNNLDLAKGLSLGQAVKIPLISTNFVQATEAGQNESLIPIHHIVGANESLGKIAATYGVSALSIKKWSNLKSDAVAKGSKLTIGFLKVSKDLSAFANKSIKIAPSQPVNGSAPNVVTEPKEVVVKEKTAEKKSESNIEKNVPKVSESAKSAPSVSNNSNGGGFFKSLYEEQKVNKTESLESGTSGVFKTSTGWQDAKYYCFSNTAPQGTVVKVTSYLTGKTIFAKVLDQIPDIKQNTGLTLQLSNAAAQELGVAESKFECSVSYYK
ncbi:MAG: hypothetical protein NVS3B19_17950 [Ginsengibacter sp.]